MTSSSSIAKFCLRCGTGLTKRTAFGRRRLVCPKCGNREQRQSAACARCGLMFSKYRAGQFEGGMSADAEELWRRIRARFDQPALHASFIELCAQRGELLEAARRYRVVRTEEGRAEAQPYLDQIVLRVQSSLSDGGSRERRGRGGAQWVLLGVAMLAVAGLTFTVLRFLGNLPPVGTFR